MSKQELHITSLTLVDNHQFERPPAKHASSTPDLYTRIENEMLATVSGVIETTVLLFAALTALFSIISPKVKTGAYSLLILLPLVGLLLPAQANAAADNLDD